jgi:hypothetical protein
LAGDLTGVCLREGERSAQQNKQSRNRELQACLTQESLAPGAGAGSN